MGHVKGDVEPLVDPRQVALIAPQIETLASDPFKEGGEGGDHVQLRLPRTHGQTIGDQRRRLLLDAHLQGVVGCQQRLGLAELGRHVEVAADEEDRVGMGSGDSGIPRLGAAAGARLVAGSGQLGGLELCGCQRQVGAALGRAGGGYHGTPRALAQTVEDRALCRRHLQHGLGQHGRLVPPLHVPVVVSFAAGQIVDEEQALRHGPLVAVAHERSRHPHGPVHGHTVGAGQGLDTAANTVLLTEPVQVDDALTFLRAISRRVDQVRRALLCQPPAFAVGAVESDRVMQ